MPLDVVSEIEIERPRPAVAGFASDPDNTADWDGGVRRVDWVTPRPVGVGSMITMEARFLGRDLVSTYRIVEAVAHERLVMATAAGPFPMETVYTFADTTSGGTRMTVRRRGEPDGFLQLLVPAMASAIRRADRRSLARLKALLEYLGHHDRGHHLQ